MAAGTIGINQGTQTGVATDAISGTTYQIVKVDVGAIGASNPYQGYLALGTPLQVLGTTGVAAWGTLAAAAGAGTKQYVSRISIVVAAGTVDVAVTNIGVGGSAGAGVLERGQFVPGGGITNNYNPVIASGTNGTLAYWLGGAGTVSITVNYWQGT